MIIFCKRLLMPEMVRHVLSASFSSSTGRNREYQNPERASSTSSDKCTRPKNSLVRMGPLPCTAQRVLAALVYSSPSVLCLSGCSTRVCWMFSRRFAFFVPSVRRWFKQRLTFAKTK